MQAHPLGHARLVVLCRDGLEQRLGAVEQSPGSTEVDGAGLDLSERRGDERSDVFSAAEANEMQQGKAGA
jgi:hypothetical protein